MHLQTCVLHTYTHQGAMSDPPTLGGKSLCAMRIIALVTYLPGLK